MCWVDKLLAKLGLATISVAPLCPIKLPQSHRVVKATTKRNDRNSLRGFISVYTESSVWRTGNRVTTYLLKPRRMQTLVSGRLWWSPGRRLFHLLSSQLRWWIWTPQPCAAAASTRPYRASCDGFACDNHIEHSPNHITDPAAHISPQQLPTAFPERDNATAN